MFQNIHLANYVNQHGVPVAGQLHPQPHFLKTKAIVKGQPVYPPIASVAPSRGISRQPLIGGLPRQSSDLIHGFSSPDSLTNVQLLAVGSRLSTKTYARKESQNSTQRQQLGNPPLTSQQRNLRPRQQIQNVATQHRTQQARNAQPSNGQLVSQGSGHPRRTSSLNSDLILNERRNNNSAQSQRQQRRRLQEGRKYPSGTGQGYQASTSTSGFGTVLQLRPPPHYKHSNLEPAKLPGESVIEAHEESVSIPLNIEVDNIETAHQVVTTEEQNAFGENELRSLPHAPMQEESDNLSLTPKGVNQKTMTQRNGVVMQQLTVQAAQAARRGPRRFNESDTHLDQDHSSLHYGEESRENFATSSIVTANYVVTAEDYQGLGNQTSASYHKQTAMQGNKRQNSQKFKILGQPTNASQQVKRTGSVDDDNRGINPICTVENDPSRAGNPSTVSPPKVEATAAPEADAKNTDSPKQQLVMRLPNGLLPKTPNKSSHGSYAFQNYDEPKKEVHGTKRLKSGVQSGIESLTARNVTSEIEEGTKIARVAQTDADSVPDEMNDYYSLHQARTQSGEKLLKEREAACQVHASLNFNADPTISSNMQLNSSRQMRQEEFSLIENMQMQALAATTNSNATQTATPNQVEVQIDPEIPNEEQLWRQKQQRIFGNNRSSMSQAMAMTQQRQIVMGKQYQGMRGSKLARHSQFMRMHSRQRKVFECNMSQDMTNETQLIFMQQLPPLEAYVSPPRRPAFTTTQARVKRQTIEVFKQPKADQSRDFRAPTAMQRSQQTPKSKVENNEAFQKNCDINAKNDLRSWASSQENAQEPLMSAVMEMTKDIDIGTIRMDTPKNVHQLLLKKISKQNSESPDFRDKLERTVPDWNEVNKLAIDQMLSQDTAQLQLHDATSGQRRETGNTARVSRNTVHDLINSETEAVQAPITKNTSTIVDIRTKTLVSPRDQATTISNQQKTERQSNLINLPPPVSIETHKSNLDSGDEEQHQVAFAIEDAVYPAHRVTPKGVLTPTLQKRTAHPRQSKSQNTRRRQRTNQLLEAEEVVVGTRFKPQIVFRQSDLQNLYENAEQNVQQVVERVICEDLEFFQGFAYSASKSHPRTKSSNRTSAYKLATIAQKYEQDRSQDHLKYEFIERLLKHTDQKMTEKTLREMTQLYQELLEKNCKASSIAGGQHMQSQNTSLNCGSQQSIFILTDKQTAALSKHNGVNSQTFDGLVLSQSAITRKIDSVTLQGVRGSAQIELTNFQDVSPLVLVEKGLKLGSSRGSMTALTKEVNSTQGAKPGIKGGRAVIGTQGSLSNTLILDLNSKRWSSGRALGEEPVIDENKVSKFEVEGKRVSILNAMKDRQDTENNIISERLEKEQETNAEETAREVPLSFLKQGTLGFDNSSSMNQKELERTLLHQSLELEAARRSEEYQPEGAQVLFSHTEEDQVGAQDVEDEVMVTNLTLKPLMNLGKEISPTCLTPRIQEIEAQIIQKNLAPQLLTQEDVQRAASVLQFDNMQLLHDQFGGIKHITAQNMVKLQIARSAYLGYRANLMQRKNIVGRDEVKKAKQRQDFITEQFRSSQSRGLHHSAVHTQTQSTNKVSVASPSIVSPIGPSKLPKSAANAIILGQRQSSTDANESSDYFRAQAANNSASNQPCLILFNIENQGKQPGLSKQRSISQAQHTHQIILTKQHQNTNTSMKSSSAQNQYGCKHVSNMPGVASSLIQVKIQNDRGSSQPKIIKGSTSRQSSSMSHALLNSNKTKKKLSDSAEANLDMNRIQKKEESQVPATQERKKIMKHELKVPKAGQLENVRASRLKKLSSNQVAGFKIRSSETRKSSTNLDQSRGILQSYGAEKDVTIAEYEKQQSSNKDLADFLTKRQKGNTRSSSHLMQKELRPDKQLEVTSNEEDDENEVGTQMMVSRANLQNALHQSVVSPNGKSMKGESEAIFRDEKDLQRVGLQRHTTHSWLAWSSKPKSSFKAIFNSEGRNMKEGKTQSGNLNICKMNSNFSVEGSAKSKSGGASRVGTIRVKELYQNVDASSKVPLLNQSRAQSRNNLKSTSREKSGLKRHMTQPRKPQVKPKGEGTNFERLSGLIQAQEKNVQRTKLIEHYRRIKQAKKNAKTTEDWQKATPVISKGSTFYKDLFEMRGKIKDDTLVGNYLDARTNMNERRDSSHNSDLQDNASLMNALLFNRTMPQRTATPMMLQRDPRAKRRDTFIVSKNALSLAKQKLIRQLLTKVNGNSDQQGPKVKVSPLRENCLIQYILDEWNTVFRGQLRQFKHFCSYSAQLQVRGPDGNIIQSEAYTVILYGNHTPISICCKQLICFQFLKETQSVHVYCLEPSCARLKLESKLISSQIFNAIFIIADRAKSDLTKKSSPFALNEGADYLSPSLQAQYHANNGTDNFGEHQIANDVEGLALSKNYNSLGSNPSGADSSPIGIQLRPALINVESPAVGLLAESSPVSQSAVLVNNQGEVVASALSTQILSSASKEGFQLRVPAPNLEYESSLSKKISSAGAAENNIIHVSMMLRNEQKGEEIRRTFAVKDSEKQVAGLVSRQHTLLRPTSQGLKASPTNESFMTSLVEGIAIESLQSKNLLRPPE